jgi:hypothetical protein
LPGSNALKSRAFDFNPVYECATIALFIVLSAAAGAVDGKVFFILVDRGA